MLIACIAFIIVLLLAVVILSGVIKAREMRKLNEKNGKEMMDL